MSPTFIYTSKISLMLGVELLFSNGRRVRSLSTTRYGVNAMNNYDIYDMNIYEKNQEPLGTISILKISQTKNIQGLVKT